MARTTTIDERGRRHVSPAARATTGPRHWSSWVNAIVGLWLFLSPWFLGGSEESSWNHWIIGAVVAMVALMSWQDLRLKWINVAAGIWLFLSPWILSYVYEEPSWNAWICGAIVALSALAGLRRPVVPRTGVPVR